jgi:hypothetical protein
MAVSLSANVRNRRKGRDNHTDREGPQTTQLSRSLRIPRRASMGHEDAFPQPRLSARCRFRKKTITGMPRNGRDAPKPGVRLSWVERVKPTRSDHPLVARSIDRPRAEVFSTPLSRGVMPRTSSASRTRPVSMRSGQQSRSEPEERISFQSSTPLCGTPDVRPDRPSFLHAELSYRVARLGSLNSTKWPLRDPRQRPAPLS